MRRGAVAALAALVFIVASVPAAAHGLASRGDLPLPKSFFVYAAALAVVLSFLIASFSWKEETDESTPSGRALGRWTTTVRTMISPFVRTIGLLALGVTLLAAWAGASDPGANLAPVMLYVVFWVGVLWLGAVLGDVWRMLNPLDTIAMFAGGRIGTAPEPPADDRSLAWSHWPAAAGLLVFQWLELAHPDPSAPRVVAVWLSLYCIVMLACAARWGRAWLQTGEGFTVLFRLVAAISPLGRDPDGTLRLRMPFSGLGAVAPRRGLSAVVLCVLGGTTFDGVSRSSRYDDMVIDLSPWTRSLVNTVGLLVTIGVIGGLYVLVARLTARMGQGDAGRIADRYAATLVPIALAYSVAHYFSLLVFDGQGAIRLLSDPLGRGWNLFGTADHTIDYSVLSTGAIAVVQVVAIVVGHAAAVFLAHDRAVRDFGARRAARSQLPMLVLMIGLTVTGLTLLLSA